MTNWTALVSAEELANALGDDDLVVLERALCSPPHGCRTNGVRRTFLALAIQLSTVICRPSQYGGRIPGRRHDSPRRWAWGITPPPFVWTTPARALASARAWFLLRALGQKGRRAGPAGRAGPR